MQLAEYISNLLVQHDCVIVPDFGGFITNYKPASIDADKKRILPPSKGVLFNPNLITNDGLLGHSVGEGESLQYSDALIFIKNQVDLWKDSLKEGKRIEIGEIGFLYKQNDTIVFEQGREVNLLLSAYGLSGVTFVNFSEATETKKQETVTEVVITPVQEVQTQTPIVQLDVSEKIEKVQEEEEAEKIIPISRKKRNGWKYAAAAVVLPFMFYSYWIPAETDFLSTGNIQIADFNPIHKTAEPVYKKQDHVLVLTEKDTEWKSFEELTENLSENVKVYNYQFDDELYIPVKLDELVVEEIAIPESETIHTNLKQPYHVIGGCFSVKENAEQLVLDLNKKGFQASLLDFNNGLYRVSAGDFVSRSEAKTELENFKNDGFSGWILKK